MRDYHRKLVATAEGLGATDIRIVPGKHHPKLVCRSAAGIERWFSVAASPSDRRGVRNDIARLRRVLRSDGGSH